MGWHIDIGHAEYYSYDDAKLNDVLVEVEQQKTVAIDTETTGLVVWKDMPLFFSLSWGTRRICLEALALEKMRPIFAQPDREWVFANAKYDLHILANAGYRIAGHCIDTQVMHAMLYEDDPHRLAYMGKQLLGWVWKDLLEDWNKKQYPCVGDYLLHVFATDPQKLIEYASNDALGTMRIYEILKKELLNSPTHSLYPELYPNLWELFHKTEMPFTKVLWNCSREGALIDTQFIQNIAVNLNAELAQVEKDIVQEAGCMVNPNSPTQLRELFYKKYKVKPLDYSKGGKKGVRQPKVDSEFLEHYEDDVPLAGLLLKQRSLSKMKGTYVDGLPKHFDPNGRIHTSINQDIARTGRISSSDPNLTNIPTVENDKYSIRSAFIAGDGNVIICADYKALEMRLLACAAMERDMIDIFLKDWDIHIGNASLVYGVPYEDIAAAKKKAKADLDDYDKKCLKYRADIKAIGFG